MYQVFHSIIAIETPQRRIPNNLFNADIRYSENTKISLKHEEMEREKQCKFLFTCLSVYYHTCTMWRLYKLLLPAIIRDLAVE